MSNKILVKAKPTLSNNVLIRKEIAVQQLVGGGTKPTFGDMYGAFRGRGTKPGTKVGIGGRLRGLAGMAGKAGAMAATAQQTAEAMQGGNIGAPFQAGVTYQGLDPTATMNPNIAQQIEGRKENQVGVTSVPLPQENTVPLPALSPPLAGKTTQAPAATPSSNVTQNQQFTGVPISNEQQQQVQQQVDNLGIGPNALAQQAQQATAPVAPTPYAPSAQAAMIQAAVPPQPQPPQPVVVGQPYAGPASTMSPPIAAKTQQEMEEMGVTGPPASTVNPLPAGSAPPEKGGTNTFDTHNWQQVANKYQQKPIQPVQQSQYSVEAAHAALAPQMPRDDAIERLGGRKPQGYASAAGVTNPNDSKYAPLQNTHEIVNAHTQGLTRRQEEEANRITNFPDSFEEYDPTYQPPQALPTLMPQYSQLQQVPQQQQQVAVQQQQPVPPQPQPMSQEQAGNVLMENDPWANKNIQWGTSKAFVGTLFDKLGPDMVYKMTPHEIGAVSALMYLKLS